MKKYFDFIISSSGRKVTTGSVSVLIYGTATPASLFSDAAGTVPIANPVPIDSRGYFEFYAADGRYSLTVNTPDFNPVTLTDIVLDDPASGADIGYTPAGAGAVATTVQAKLRESVSVFDFMTPDQIADVQANTALVNVTAAIQAAIAATGGAVFFPNGTYICANLQVKTGLRLHGESHLAILKLIANATSTSYNGSIADSNGRYPGNVICSTLNHDGGVWNDGGIRAKDEANTTFIFENVIIENLTIDGNKANNQVGDVGLNASAMGAGVSIHQCKNVTVRNCRIINHRMDGVHVGYTLHGGSDYCNIVGNYFEGNQRTNIALITGKYNTVSFNSGGPTTGGTGTGAGAVLDIEANFTDEVNYRHTIIGNRMNGLLSIVAQNVAKLQGTTISGNTWKGQLFISGSGMTQGVVIDGDTFIAESPTTGWLVRYGPNVAGTSETPTLIKNCTVTGFARVLQTATSGAQENITVEGCLFSVGSFGQLTRGYKVQFVGNTFNFTGTTDAYAIQLSNTLGGTVPNQGQITFARNKFIGTSAASFLTVVRDATWAQANNDYLFIGNDVLVTGATNTFTTPSTMTVEQNRISNFKPISISSLSLFRLTDNDIRSSAAENLFANQSSTFQNVEISENDFSNVSVNLIRPLDSTVTDNRIVTGNITILYSFTGGIGGVGRNFICFNKMTAKTTIANPFVVTTGGSFLISDFLGNDQYFYNPAVGYTSGASIAASIAGKYDGTFV